MGFRATAKLEQAGFRNLKNFGFVRILLVWFASTWPTVSLRGEVKHSVPTVTRGGALSIELGDDGSYALHSISTNGIVLRSGMRQIRGT